MVDGHKSCQPPNDLIQSYLPFPQHTINAAWQELQRGVSHSQTVNTQLSLYNSIHKTTTDMLTVLIFSSLRVCVISRQKGEVEKKKNLKLSSFTAPWLF